MLGLANLGWSIRDMRQHVIHTLKTANYHTALCGTQHIVSGSVSQIGYDEIVRFEPRGTAAASGREAAAKSQPFFPLAMG
jgi:hypothetical protein